MQKIEEIIVVEGRDDTAAIRRSVDAVTIETHGFGIRPETWELIDRAYRSKGIIVFTDPDHAGDQIRRRIMERFPDAKEAFLDRSQAEKDGDIGIENASPESIREALDKAHRSRSASEAEGAAGGAASQAEAFTSADLFAWGLDGIEGAAKRRRMVGLQLGIGMATGKTFLQRLNRFGITREEVEEALTQIVQR